MKKFKTVEKNGKIVVTKTEERFPDSAGILMSKGFFIIFFNMALGLLPVTVWGTRLKYFKCSISQLYTTVACLCFIIFSAIFVPVVFLAPDKDVAEDQKKMTNLVILMAMGITHVIGYLILLIRGHYVASKFPMVWQKLCKLFQTSVIDVYGKDCHLILHIKSFVRWSIWEYVWITGSTNFGLGMVSGTYGDGIREGFKYYNLDLMFPPGTNWTHFLKFQNVCFGMGYVIWKSFNSSHVLGTILLCYIIIVVTICLKSVNQQIYEFLETYANREAPGLALQIPRIKFKWQVGRRTNLEPAAAVCDEIAIIERLEGIKNIMLIAEDLLGTVSKLWGVSLIVETLILIAAGTTNTYNFLSTFKGKSNINEAHAPGLPDNTKWMELIVTLLVHFYFLYKCCTLVDKMQFQAKQALNLLKRASCHHLPDRIYEKVQALKQDLASTTITLTASNYFQVNKFLLTSVASQITTYVIVLLQFAQQENNPQPLQQND